MHNWTTVSTADLRVSVTVVCKQLAIIIADLEGKQLLSLANTHYKVAFDILWPSNVDILENSLTQYGFNVGSTISENWHEGSELISF